MPQDAHCSSAGGQVGRAKLSDAGRDGVAQRVRPRPGGSAASTPAPARPLAAEEENPAGLIALATPLLELLSRLRFMAQQPNPAELRGRVENELTRFAARADAAGVPPDQRDRAQYALCASLDEAVLATPWGARSAWDHPSLVMTFHADVGEGRFLDLLRQVEGNAQFRPVLELMFLCLSLGTMGPHRGQPDGLAAVEAIRQTVAAALAVEPPPTLSLRWRGETAPFVPGRFRLPVWVTASAAVAGVAALYLLLSLHLNDVSDALFARMLAAAPSRMPVVTRQPVATPPPPAPPPAEPSAADRLKDRLAGAGLGDAVQLAGTPAIPVLRIPSRVLFATASATLLPSGAKLLDTVAAALKGIPGRFTIVGYTDDRPVRTVLFPSAFQLSAAQAHAARGALARAGLETAGDEGRASADPIAPNTTADGRERNRRIEIVIEPPAAPAAP